MQVLNVQHYLLSRFKDGKILKWLIRMFEIFVPNCSVREYAYINTHTHVQDAIRARAVAAVTVAAISPQTPAWGVVAYPNLYLTLANITNI